MLTSRLVDRLLASPHYGERMAMYWLDLVRYADTVGYHGDQEHHISPYRDWVINVVECQHAIRRVHARAIGGRSAARFDGDQKVASGYNRVLQTSHEGGVQPKEYLAIYAADHVRNLSAVWMGATHGLRPMPRPQVRPIHDARLLLDGGFFRRYR